MLQQPKSIRTFIGAKDFEQSRSFYRKMGFEEFTISNSMSYFKVSDNVGFYLQDYYVQDWLDNSMVFLEVDDVEQYWNFLNELSLHERYQNVKVSAIKDEDWGRECFLNDPSGVLWHIGEFRK